MNTSQIPPGGWQFHEPSTGWWAPHPIGHTFDQQVNNIIKHRNANPAITAKLSLSTDPGAVGTELIRFQQRRGAIQADVPPKLTPPLSSPQMTVAVREAVAAVKKMASGARSISQWIEMGLPHVEQAEANARAEICVKCPKNNKKPLTDLFTTPVAAMIKKNMERQEGVNLRTPWDADLATCDACWCPMKTKVWYPTDLVLENLKPDQKAELHPACWILKLLSLTSSSVVEESQTNTLADSSAATS